MNDQTMNEHLRDISKLMKSLAHPIRIQILHLLQEDEMSVGDLREELQTTHSNITQHLNILRNQGIIDYRKDANFIFNRITDWRIIELLKQTSQLYSSDSKNSF